MKKKILIIDDEKNIRLALKSCLGEEGYEIDTAVNGEEGLLKIIDDKFDLVLLDLKMPGLDGIEVVRRMRSKDIGVDVIIMTAYGTVEKAVEAMKLGVIDFLSKPFTPEDIRTIVEDILTRRTLTEDKLSSFHDFLRFAKNSILTQDYVKARTYLKKAISENMDSPEPHNLLGVLLENKGDRILAIKHYRAALDLDPAYRPAQKNLERITRFIYSEKGIDLGDEDSEENKE